MATLAEIAAGLSKMGGSDDTTSNPLTFGQLGSTTQGGLNSLLGNGTGDVAGAVDGNALQSLLQKQGGSSGLGAGLGMNVGTGQLALGGLSALSGIWGAYNSNKLANQQFKFTKDTTNTNLNNQIKSYNTALEDRITARAATQGQDSAYVNDYLNKNRLTR